MGRPENMIFSYYTVSGFSGTLFHSVKGDVGSTCRDPPAVVAGIGNQD